MLLRSTLVAICIFLSIGKGGAVRASDYEILDLRPGDVLLMSLNCGGCEKIESATGSKFSHMGMILSRGAEEFIVAQSLGKVSRLSLEKFLQQKRPETQVHVYRSVELEHLFQNDSESFKLFEKSLQFLFVSLYEFLPFDSEYLWNNFDFMGREKLYCSEFVTKLLNEFLSNKIRPLPMDFSDDWNFWEKYFVGMIGSYVPQGLPGNSPSFFARTPLFFPVTTL